MTSKMIVCIIVNDYNEKELTQLNNMDLQSVQFVSYMIKNIQKYKTENSVITPQCNNFIYFTTNRFLVKIPENKTILEKELLQKILPFDFDKEYLSNTKTNMTSNANAKQFNMICILFTDIVNYTELAKKHDETIIFQLLNNIYVSFDILIKKYPHLQKIETIGDAYMVVGDIFRNTINHPLVVKEIILFALDIVKEIKKIQTPDNVPLCIRIGIHIGNVSIGILGNEIPRLCVVGNAVNLASRLQSTADIDTIQFSRHIYEQMDCMDFDTKINITIKENIFLKNMGTITTYNITPPHSSQTIVHNDTAECVSQ
jgi:class 3 adenylate cyclase